MNGYFSVSCHSGARHLVERVGWADFPLEFVGEGVGRRLSPERLGVQARVAETGVLVRDGFPWQRPLEPTRRHLDHQIPFTSRLRSA